jgi:hypothetical protein
MVDHEVQQPRGTESSAASQPLPVSSDRRRPGRADYSNPALIDLLRGTPSAIKPAEPQAERRDDLAPAKGILMGLLMVVPFWAMVGFAVWYLWTG